MDHSANAVYSDMPDYYKYMTSLDGNRFDLTPVTEDGDGESVNQLEFCHPIVIDAPPSINAL
jgi:hypothetical protein